MIPSIGGLFLLKDLAAQVDAAETLDEAKQIVNTILIKYVDLMTENFHGTDN